MMRLYPCLICGENNVVAFPKRLHYRWCKDCVKMYEEMETSRLCAGKRKKGSEKCERVFKIIRTNDATAALFCVRFE